MDGSQRPVCVGLELVRWPAGSRVEVMCLLSDGRVVPLLDGKTGRPVALKVIRSSPYSLDEIDRVYGAMVGR